MIEIDKSLADPIYTPSEAKRQGFTDEEIEKIFGADALKQLKAEQIKSQEKDQKHGA